MKEEKKQTRVKADSPHRIVNIHRSNLTPRDALEESAQHKNSRSTKTMNGRRPGRKRNAEEGVDVAVKTPVKTPRTSRARSNSAEGGKRSESTLVPNFSSRRNTNANKREYSLEDFPLLANTMEVQESKNKGKKPKNGFHGSVKIIPLGGLDQIGMNITAIETEDTLIIVDCGLAFPSGDMLGIDLVIPDISYIKSKIHKMKGFVITHGHEDHIGALPYVLQQINVPIYATKLTLALI